MKYETASYVDWTDYLLKDAAVRRAAQGPHLRPLSAVGGVLAHVICALRMIQRSRVAQATHAREHQSKGP